jgi:hypothetical protein
VRGRKRPPVRRANRRAGPTATSSDSRSQASRNRGQIGARRIDGIDGIERIDGTTPERTES